MNKLQREMMAFQLRKEGKTFRAIGKYFIVSSVRARQMVLSHQKREQGINESDDDLVKHLLCTECSVSRILNCLKNDGYSGDIDALVAGGGKKLFHVEKLGIKSIKVIANALSDIGKIDDPMEWLRT